MIAVIICSLLVLIVCCWCNRRYKVKRRKRNNGISGGVEREIRQRIETNQEVLHQQQPRHTSVVAGTVVMGQDGRELNDLNPTGADQPVYPAEDVKQHQSLSKNMHGSLVFKEVLAPV